MYNFNGRLGEAPSFESILTPRGVPSGDFAAGKSGWMVPVFDVPDPDLIAIHYYSPPSGYPPQRIGNYDVMLAEHQTLNAYPADAPIMKLPAYEKGFLGSIGRVRYKTATRPMTAGVLTPRHEPAALKQTLMLTPPIKAGQERIKPMPMQQRKKIGFR